MPVSIADNAWLDTNSTNNYDETDNNKGLELQERVDKFVEPWPIT
jgi:hypothetical protein